ncbi:proteoglycan 4b isoform 2-T2 [Spinachia spinachia]
MSSTVLSAVILLACALTFSAAQTSCKSRCGAEYYRGYMCQCDYNCLSYGECCKDFESECTTKNSCKGRCGENFKRGRLCTCDPNCNAYKQCCPDYRIHCDAEEEISSAASATAPVKTDSCNKVNGNKPKEPTVSDATEAPAFSKEKDPDYSSNNEVEDPDEIPILESTGGPLSADLLDPIPTEPVEDPDTLEFTTETFTASPQVSDSGPTQAEDGSASPYPPGAEAPTESAGITLPQPTTAADDVSSQPAATPVPQSQDSLTEGKTAGQEEVQPEDDRPPEVLTEGPSDEPEVTSLSETQTSCTTVAGPTQPSSSSGLDISVISTVSASTPDPTPIPEATTSTPLDDANKDAGGVTTGPASSLADREDPATTARPLNIPTVATKPASSEVTSKPQDKPDPDTSSPDKPGSKPETKPLNPAQTHNTDNPREYQADDSNDTDLCSGRPVGAVTTLRNGTVVVFRGHYFWSLDKYMVPSPARVITQVWGVPSPIDTAFTRCNCQGKTYIFKGSQYWRFENDVLEPNYPKAIKTGFDGLRGQITAALSVPQYQMRRESVYFFKRGGSVQKYSYKFGHSPSCGSKVQSPVYTVHGRMVRSAASHLEPVVNIRTSWRRFPSTITAAVSVPSSTDPERYKYYVFSRSTSYNVRISSTGPVVSAPSTNEPPQSNDFLKCPKRA